MAQSSQPAAVPPPANGFFTDSKKGEVNELKEVCLRLLRRKADQVLAAKKHQHGKRCQEEARSYQKSYCVHDSWY